MCYFFFFTDTATTEIYTYCHTLSLLDALPISTVDRHACAPGGRASVRVRRSAQNRRGRSSGRGRDREHRRRTSRAGSARCRTRGPAHRRARARSEEHTSELQSLMRISYAVFCLKQKKIKSQNTITHNRI